MNRAKLILGIIVAVFIFERLLSLTPLYKNIELATYDLRAKLSTDKGLFNSKFKHADKKIVIVAVDKSSRKILAKNKSLDLGTWPWRRDVWADVLSFVEKGNPKAVIFDMVFNELNENSWNDRRFSQTLRGYKNVVLATSLGNPKYLVDKMSKSEEIENSSYIPTATTLNVKINKKNLENAITYYSHSAVHELYTSSNTIAVDNKVSDDDAVVRRSQPIFKLIKDKQTYFMPSLAFAGFLKYMGDDGSVVIKKNKINYKGREIPINNKGEANINWHGFGHSYSYVPISKILLNDGGNNEISPAYFNDKIVIIAEVDDSVLATSVNRKLAQAEIDATILDNFINDTYSGTQTRKFVTKMPGWLTFILVVLSCIMVAAAGIFTKRAKPGLILGLVYIIAYIVFCILEFSNPVIRLWVPMTGPIFYFLVISGTIFAIKFKKEWLLRTKLISIFKGSVSEDVLQSLLKNPDESMFKNTRGRVVVMFCDIKEFGSLIKRAYPDELAEDLNSLMNEIGRLIFENGGIIDNTVGDCIIAYWGAPTATMEDSFKAVKSALEIKKKVNELKLVSAKVNKTIFDIKIGINTGEAILALSDVQNRIKYTPLGDTVKVASELKSNCQRLKRDILISQTSYNEIKTKVLVLEAGKIGLKGKPEAEVYEPIALIEEETNN